MSRPTSVTHPRTFTSAIGPKPASKRLKRILSDTDDGEFFSPITSPSDPCLVGQPAPQFGTGGGQTYPEFVQLRSSDPSLDIRGGGLQRVYLLPLDYDQASSGSQTSAIVSLAHLSGYVQHFFPGIRITELPALTARETRYLRRETHADGGEQLLVEDVVNIAKRKLPSDAICMFVVTLKHLWVGGSLPATSGVYFKDDKVGVLSLAALHPAATAAAAPAASSSSSPHRPTHHKRRGSGVRTSFSRNIFSDKPELAPAASMTNVFARDDGADDDAPSSTGSRSTRRGSLPLDPLYVRRASLLVVRQLASVFGFKPCVFYKCIFNGQLESADVEIPDGSPARLCLVCLRKTLQLCNCDGLKRYKVLLAFLQRSGGDWSAEQRWLEDRVAYLEAYLS